MVLLYQSSIKCYGSKYVFLKIYKYLPGWKQIAFTLENCLTLRIKYLIYDKKSKKIILTLVHI